MDTISFLKNYLRGGKNIKITKRKQNKSDFVKSLLEDDRFINAVQKWRTTNSIKGNTISGHPDAVRLHKELNSLVADNANDKVSVDMGSSSKKLVEKLESRKMPAPTNPIKSKSATNGTSKSKKGISLKRFEAAKGLTGGRMTQEDREKAKTLFLRQVIDYEIDRNFGDYDILNPAPPRFSNWSDNPIEKAIQQEWVERFNRQVDAGDFVELARLKAAGVGGVGGGVGEGGEIELADLLAEEFLKNVGVADAIGLSTTINRAGLDVGTEAQQSRARRSRAENDLADLLQEVMKSNKVQNTIKASQAAKELGETIKDIVRPPDPQQDIQLIKPGKEQKQLQLLQRLGSRFGGPQPTVSETEERKRAADIASTMTRGREPEFDPTITQTEEEKKGEGEEEEKKTKERPFEPRPFPPVETEKKKRRRKPDPRPPIPPVEEEDTDDDDDRKPKTTTYERHDPKDDAKPELRPFFDVGGEDVLRLTEEEKKVEAVDKALFSFVPGYVYEGDDNPLTRLARIQYLYRMQNTTPDAPYVEKPNDAGQKKNLPTTYLFDPYNHNSNHILVNQYQKANLRLGEQDRRTSSVLLDKSRRFYNEPDLQAQAYELGLPNIRQNKLMRGFRFSQKTMI